MKAVALLLLLSACAMSAEEARLRQTDPALCGAPYTPEEDRLGIDHHCPEGDRP